MGRVVDIGESEETALLGSLPQQFRQIRQDLGLTMQEVATRSGISRVTLHRIESGRHTVSATALACVARTLGMRLSLMDLAESEPETIRLADYPGLQSLGWQLSPQVQLTRHEAWSLYAHNWRHLDHSLLEDKEWGFIRELESECGRLGLHTRSTHTNRPGLGSD